MKGTLVFERKGVLLGVARHGPSGRAALQVARRCQANGLDSVGTMELSTVEEDGLRVVEGEPDQCFMSRADDVNRVLEACFSSRVHCALLYAKNLTYGFFDLSSGDAGAVLQKLRNYGVRLAVVCPAGSVQFSSRFGEMLAEEHLRSHFGVFETRHAAREWLAQLAAS